MVIYDPLTGICVKNYGLRIGSTDYVDVKGLRIILITFNKQRIAWILTSHSGGLRRGLKIIRVNP